MPHIRIITPNIADSATLTASPAAVATLPVTNLQDQTRGRVWRSTSLAAQTINGDLSSATNLSAMSLGRHNLSSVATVRLRLYSAVAQGGSVLYDSGTISLGSSIPWGIFVWGVDTWGGGNIFSNWAYSFTTIWFDMTLNVRSFSLVVDDSGNGDGYIQASRLFLGNYFEPVVNTGQGMKISWQESSKQQRTDGGSLRTDAAQPYRRITFNLPRLSEAERINLFEIARRNGLRNDMFVSIFPEDGTVTERDFSAQMKITQMPEFTYTGFDTVGIYSTDLVLEET